ncbi:MAG: helix-turn-helix domain-containing protein [Firmicutes bacterium]|nr:helix-turn-helix domain-containing protein [Alicyclobacillaceae bacterium]MCL6497815.1 helix-turn-helix domain-containing protein [Bacillota bacterium]
MSRPRARSSRAPQAAGLGPLVAQRRRELGLSQVALAARVGISRQNLALIEAGKRLPQLPVARALALALGLDLNALSSALEAPTPETSRWRWLLGHIPSRPTPVVWSWVGDHLVLAPAAWLAVPGSAMDALWDPVPGTLVPLPGAPSPADTLLVAGCDPLLFPLWQATHNQAGWPALRIVQLGSVAALEALAQGEVAVAGTHLAEPDRGHLLAGEEWVRIRYLQWETGLVGTVSDRPEALTVLREPGSAARALWDRQGTPLGGPTVEVGSHLEVARVVAHNPHARGVSLALYAHWLELPFTLWAVEAFEWVTRRTWMAREPRVAAFLHWLSSPTVARELSRYPGIAPDAPGRLASSGS